MVEIDDVMVFTVSQKAIVKDKKGRILMMEKSGKGHWDLPGGKLDANEKMAHGLVREVYEETGFENIKVGPIVFVGRRQFEEEEKPDRIMIFYECEVDQKIEKIKLSEEHSQWRLMEAKDIKDSKKYEINPVVSKALAISFGED